jgi:fatty-acyl-CoA synthase
MAEMAPSFGTGIGMTESAGFVSFTPPDIPVEEMAGQVGQAFPDLAPITIRAPMNEDGTAGEELADEEIVEICYEGPIVFLGYYNQPEATAEMISKDGYLYSGDLGYFKDMGTYRALYLTGREKFVIKQKGYNVFPGEVEAYIAQLEGVDMVEVVGMEHLLFDEGIVAFVRVQEGAELNPEMVMAHCEGIASFKRPQYVVLWPHDEQFPLTRVAKVDKMALQKIAEPMIEQLRSEGQWDAGV